jgi:hypothetical protein
MNARFQEFDRLLRNPSAVAENVRLGRPTHGVFLAALSSIIVGAGLFGAALASSRGGLQILYSSLKLPIACLLTLILVTPALAALAQALRRPLSLACASVFTLAATARAALLLLALAPIVWLAFDHGVAYHRGILVACGCYGAAGLAALHMLRLAIGRDLRSLVIIGLFSIVLLPAGGQSAWLLRPFVGRPAQTEVPFLRGRESSFGESVHRSVFSSMEIYR